MCVQAPVAAMQAMGSDDLQELCHAARTKNLVVIRRDMLAISHSSAGLHASLGLHLGFILPTTVSCISAVVHAFACVSDLLEVLAEALWR